MAGGTKHVYHLTNHLRAKWQKQTNFWHFRSNRPLKNWAGSRVEQDGGSGAALLRQVKPTAGIALPRALLLGPDEQQRDPAEFFNSLLSWPLHNSMAAGGMRGAVHLWADLSRKKCAWAEAHYAPIATKDKATPALCAAWGSDG
jgi:hypothetical protein